MARLPRIVIPNIPHHVIQRGNRKQNVFFSDEDKRIYLSLLKQFARKAGLTFWAYCLMDNHVHFIVVPDRPESLAKGFGEAHRRYTRMIHFREDWRGYLWQGRFNSFPLDESHLYAAVRYVEQNPVRASLVTKAEHYLFSSAKAHVLKKPDDLCSDFFLLREIHDWATYLATPLSQKELALFRRHGKTGRPAGDKNFTLKLEQLTGRSLSKRKPGPKPN